MELHFKVISLIIPEKIKKHYICNVKNKIIKIQNGKNIGKKLKNKNFAK